jgi:glycosyltransferase involved in cell wall biosynthesis
VHSLVRIAAWLLPARARRGAPIVVTAHAADELGPAASPSGDATPARARRHARQARRVLHEARVVVAPSRFAAGLVAAAGRTGPLVVVGHGPTDDRAPPRPPRDGFVVLALARFVPVKGLDVLLEGFALAFPEPASLARLVLAGDGPARDALATRAQALGIGDRVELPGYVEGAARAALLARADVVAVPTRGDYETFGLAALDARAAGAVALVASGGALPERVAEGGGLVVSGGRPSDWALALRAVRDEPGRVPAPDPVSVRARESWDVAAAAHRRLYEGTRPGGAPPAPSGSVR